MTVKYKYAVFILSHGRPNNVYTHNNLRKAGYTGRIYIICDDEDKTIEQYKKKYDDVIVFSKKDYVQKFDIMDNFDGNKVIVYARNACYDIARNLGLDYFLMYEDDYTSFLHRWVNGEKLKSKPVNKLDVIYDFFIDALIATKSTSIAFCQGGDLMGGGIGFHNINYKRKAMNTFLFKVEKSGNDDTLFIGRLNDDVNTYITLGKVGRLFFQIGSLNVVQKETQQNSGGNTDAYKKFGTYVKSFYSLMAAPSCIKISSMGLNSRIHHKTKWVNAVPAIIRAQYKK